MILAVGKFNCSPTNPRVNKELNSFAVRWSIWDTHSLIKMNGTEMLSKFGICNAPNT